MRYDLDAKPRMRILLRFAFAFAATLSCAWPQQNMFDTPEGRQQGASLFQTHCAYCHGAQGEGGRGADLTTGVYKHGGSDSELYATIRNGIPGTEMPTVRASDEDIWKITAFVKTLGAAGLRETPTGDPAAGKAIYAAKGKCATCHSISGDGGYIGPDLSSVGRSRSLAYLLSSLVTPDADVALTYRAVQVTTKSGKIASGIRLNEDDLSIQVRDSENNLRSFLKEDLKEIRRDKPSLMPAYGTTLNKKELDDVVAYLNSLRGAL
jgi:putative heme-binding domain-containing protein